MIKRLLDILISSLALVIFLPLFAGIALLIKFETPGPVFFMQTRVGLNGRKFRMFKFRKFGCDAPSGPGVTLVKDPRMTRMGKFLERFKLDELPQFINVLTGDMTVVGPRPETLQFAKHIKGADMEVLSVRPGIFGINQLIYRREANLFPQDTDPEVFYIKELMPLKIRNDIQYIRTATVCADLSIIIKCIFVVIVEPFISKWRRLTRSQGCRSPETYSIKS
ncbi:MAG: sugar transferase [Chitinispirillaceae bacterium]|nr:sugar transferase [Chitinispirillaceae bacterium]